MLKKVVSIFFIFICSFLKAQMDTSANAVVSPTVTTFTEEKKEKNDEPPELGDVFKPKISLGAGMLSFHGDLYAAKY